MKCASYLVWLGLCVGLVACTGSNPGDSESQPVEDISVQFRAVVKNEPFECGRIYSNVGADDGFDLELNDARFYVTDVELVRKDGSAVPMVLTNDGMWQQENLALLDFEDHTKGCPFGTQGVHDTLRGRAPRGPYAGIRFKVGVPFELNHQDQAVADPPLSLSSMFWGWNGGYKFMRVDGVVEGEGTVAMHLGSTGCVAGDTDPVSSCKHENRVQVEVDGFDPQSQALLVDFGKLFEDTSAEAGFCLSDPSSAPCTGPFDHLGLNPGGSADVFRAGDLGESLEVRNDAADAGAPANDGGADAGEVCEDAIPSKPYVWDLPEGFPEPFVPKNNPMSDAKIELGRRLFYDTKLSLNETFSCASCHDPALSFTDGLAVSEGSTGEQHRRSSMSLANVAYYSRFTWGNPLMDTLEEQMLAPLFGDTPVELGLMGHEDDLMARLKGDPTYPGLFTKAFGNDCEPVSLGHITKAIAAFERTLISGNSAYDRYWYGSDRQALSDDALEGLALFNSEKFECFHCHGGQNFSSNNRNVNVDENLFFNNGLYNEDGEGAYPTVDQGVVEITMDPVDMGLFKPPSLRNIAVTAPYMHDGSLATLDDVLDHYAAGAPDNPLKDRFIVGFEMSEDERRKLLAFLESLTDEEFLNNPKYQSPF